MLFNHARIPIEILKPKVDEEQLKNKISDPVELVKELARAKVLFAMNVLRENKKKGIVISADTIVELKGQIIGKAVDEQDAFTILNRTHP